MKWFKLDADFLFDGKILSLSDKELRIWLAIISEIAARYTGKETVFNLELNKLILSTKSKQTKFVLSLNSVCTKFELKMNLKQTENKLEIEYPNFLKKQASYFRGALTKCETLQENKNKIRKEEDKEEEKRETYPEQVQSVFNYFKEKLGKKIELNESRSNIIIKRLKEGKSVEDLKHAIDNFSKDDWPDRHKFCDLVYCIGYRNKVDNFEKWFNLARIESRSVLNIT